jgi:hypothetical protein
MSTPLTIEQAIIISGYTGILCCPIALLHEDIEKRLNRSVWTHELGNLSMIERIRNLYEEDFLAICVKK